MSRRNLIPTVPAGRRHSLAIDEPSPAAVSGESTIASLAGLITAVGVLGGLAGMASAAAFPMNIDGRIAGAFCAFMVVLGGLTWLRTVPSERWVYGVLLASIAAVTVTIPLIPNWALLPMCYVVPLSTTAQYASSKRLTLTATFAVAGYALVTTFGPHAAGRSPMLDFTMLTVVVLGTMTVIRRMQAQLSSTVRKLDHLASRDALTGALNRRAFEQRMEPWLRDEDGDQREACLVLIDVDHFKQVNDTYGHPAGDAVLKALVEITSGVLRQSDILGRVGGEEFAVLLTDTPKAGGIVAAEKLRRAIEARTSEYGTSVTISAGVALCSAAPNPWSAADAALYEAKRGGRNCIRLAATTDDEASLVVGAPATRC